MTILAGILAFLLFIAPITSFVSTVANVAANTDKVAVDVHTWRIDGCPQRQFNGTVKYLCKQKAPAVKTTPMPKQAPVYVPPPLPQVAPAIDEHFHQLEERIERLEHPAEAPTVQWYIARGWALALDHIVGVLLVIASFGVIGHGLLRIYRIWKGRE